MWSDFARETAYAIATVTLERVLARREILKA